MGEEFNLLWADSYVPADTVSALNKYQKVNHFPGMSELAKKNLLAKNMNRMIRALPGDFTFVPQTFQLPAELEPLRSWASSQVRVGRAGPDPNANPYAGPDPDPNPNPNPSPNPNPNPNPIPIPNPNPNPNQVFLLDVLGIALAFSSGIIFGGVFEGAAISALGATLG